MYSRLDYSIVQKNITSKTRNGIYDLRIETFVKSHSGDCTKYILIRWQNSQERARVIYRNVQQTVYPVGSLEYVYSHFFKQLNF